MGPKNLLILVIALLGHSWSSLGQDDLAIMGAIEDDFVTFGETYDTDGYTSFLRETVHSDSQTTNYHYWTNGSSQESGPLVFLRHEEEGVEEGFAFVLNRTEDRLLDGKEKKTWVILAMVGRSEDLLYLPVIAYVIPTNKSGGYLIQYEAWQPKRLYDSGAYAFGWDKCSASIYLPCMSRSSSAGDLETHILKDYEEDPDLIKKTGETAHVDNYMLDLWEDSLDRELIGQTIDLITSTRSPGPPRPDLKQIPGIQAEEAFAGPSDYQRGIPPQKGRAVKSGGTTPAEKNTTEASTQGGEAHGKDEEGGSAKGGNSTTKAGAGDGLKIGLKLGGGSAGEKGGIHFGAKLNLGGLFSGSGGTNRTGNANLLGALGNLLGIKVGTSGDGAANMGILGGLANFFSGGNKAQRKSNSNYASTSGSWKDEPGYGYNEEIDNYYKSLNQGQGSTKYSENGGFYGGNGNYGGYGGGNTGFRLKAGVGGQGQGWNSYGNAQTQNNNPFNFNIGSGQGYGGYGAGGQKYGNGGFESIGQVNTGGYGAGGQRYGSGGFEPSVQGNGGYTWGGQGQGNGNYGTRVKTGFGGTFGEGSYPEDRSGSGITYNHASASSQSGGNDQGQDKYYGQGGGGGNFGIHVKGGGSYDGNNQYGYGGNTPGSQPRHGGISDNMLDGFQNGMKVGGGASGGGTKIGGQGSNYGFNNYNQESDSYFRNQGQGQSAGNGNFGIRIKAGVGGSSFGGSNQQAGGNTQDGFNKNQGDSAGGGNTQSGNHGNGNFGIHVKVGGGGYHGGDAGENSADGSGSGNSGGNRQESDDGGNNGGDGSTDGASGGGENRQEQDDARNYGGDGSTDEASGGGGNGKFGFRVKVGTGGSDNGGSNSQGNAGFHIKIGGGVSGKGQGGGENNQGGRPSGDVNSQRNSGTGQGQEDIDDQDDADDAAEAKASATLLAKLREIAGLLNEDKKDHETEHHTGESPPQERRKRSGAAIKRFINSRLSDVDLFGHPGWLTQDFDNDGLSGYIGSSTVVDLPFVGFGTCPKVSSSLEDLKKATDDEAKIGFYLHPLRMHCDKDLLQTLLSLVKDGRLRLKKGDNSNLEYFAVPSTGRHSEDRLLRPDKMSHLYLAYEFAAFSKSYLWYLESKNGQRFETLRDFVSDPEISKREVAKSPYIVFRLYTAAGLLEDILRNQVHSVALTRQLLLTIKTTFLKTLQDYFRLENCINCLAGPAESLTRDLSALLGFFKFVYEKCPPGHAGSSEFEDFDSKSILRAYSNFVISESKSGRLNALNDYLT